MGKYEALATLFLAAGLVVIGLALMDYLMSERDRW